MIFLCGEYAKKHFCIGTSNVSHYHAYCSSILCFGISLVDVKWIAGCSIEHTLTYLDVLVITWPRGLWLIYHPRARSARGR